MSNKPNTKADFTEFDGRVGQAWSLHYRKQYEASTKEFRKLVDEWPDHIDANYGLGLSLRCSGRDKEAAEIFRKVKGFVEAELAKMPENPDRYQMLSKIVDQQLTLFINPANLASN